MELTWRERLSREPEWYDLRQWPLVDLQRLPYEVRRGYQQNLRVVAGVLEGRQFASVAKEAGITKGRVAQLMHRCLAGETDQPPALTQGLIPHLRLKKSVRRRPVSTLGSPSGYRCSFESLLAQVPGLEDYLVDHIRQAVKQHRRGQNLTPGPLHAQFIAFLEARNWPRDTYPFTSTSRGYESVRRFLNKTKAKFQMPRTAKRTILPRKTPVRAFQEIQIDEHHVDCNGAAAVVLQDQMEPLRLSRVSLLTARDAGTGCNLAATIALTSHPGASDLLALLEQLVQPWKPLPLSTPGLKYAAEAGFPTALGEAFCRPAFGIVRLDNALAHLSHLCRRMVCDHLGATCNFGLPKTPKARNLIEQAFGRLNVDIHRFPSTTGSHPLDPAREPSAHRKNAPYVSLKALEEVISVLLTEFNLRPLANQGGTTPLEQMSYQMRHHLIPLRAPNPGPGLKPFESMREVTVRKSSDIDSPRINFEGCQYRGAVLNHAELINQKVVIVFDIRDIRELQVLTLDGRWLGVVYAPKTWQRFPHSLATRKRINQLIREGRLSRRDPLGEYFEYTYAQRHLPKKALTLVRITDEFRIGHTGSDRADANPSVGHDPAEDTSVARALKKLPDWGPDMVKNRRSTP